MNRREALHTLAAGSAAGALAAGAVAVATPAPVTAEPIGAELAAAIEAHRATVRHDETLYGADCTPIVDQAALDVSDENIGRAFLAAMAVPCITHADVASKVSYIMGGSIGIRENGWPDEFLNLLIPDNQPMFDVGGPLVAFLQSLLPNGNNSLKGRA